MYLKRDEEKPLGKRVRLSTLLSGSTYNVEYKSYYMTDLKSFQSEEPSKKPGDWLRTSQDTNNNAILYIQLLFVPIQRSSTAT